MGRLPCIGIAGIWHEMRDAVDGHPACRSVRAVDARGIVMDVVEVDDGGR